MVDSICWMVDVGDGLFGTNLSIVHLLAGIRRSRSIIACSSTPVLGYQQLRLANLLLNPRVPV